MYVIITNKFLRTKGKYLILGQSLYKFKFFNKSSELWCI